MVLEVFSASGGGRLPETRQPYGPPAGSLMTTAPATSWAYTVHSRCWSRAMPDRNSRISSSAFPGRRPEAFSVSYATVDGTAVAGEGLCREQRHHQFAAGSCLRPYWCRCLATLTSSRARLFLPALSAPDTVVQTTLGQATILDDDAGLPTVSVGGATALEGSTGSDPIT